MSLVLDAPLFSTSVHTRSVGVARDVQNLIPWYPGNCPWKRHFALQLDPALPLVKILEMRVIHCSSLLPPAYISFRLVSLLHLLFVRYGRQNGIHMVPAFVVNGLLDPALDSQVTLEDVKKALASMK
eukprot:GHVU01200036.1.p2 GENE.GHVU01200036.1~~GHVU01200036.1.p2  ORF type:complete len:127 (+),score=1.74 GHVU01200036.1:86-466(+)